ncbi:uncharacterized protein N7503_006549 [Penicillium pulvis]|uniref:uncharacterized protein n=1 Tax=Penicillium pulvis TaxID=1562058 RepID=UPI002547896B|nr:uncharacterized protein N7503_006549 [Penicillium pulvis]KAJ5799044.1 hypothetical protein N7503_006549 [Penicillium pulvis]
MLRRRPAGERDWSGWSPMEAQAWKPGGCLTTPSGALTRNWESRKAFVLAPWQAPPNVTIEDRDAAVQRHNQILGKAPEEKPLIMYTDGSGIESKVGAAAVDETGKHIALSQMGDDDSSTVYSALRRAKNGLTIFADSQAALKALRRPRMPSGQVYLVGCLDLIRQLANKGIRTELRWIPAHQGVAGNEIVDTHAKEAAQRLEEPRNSLNRSICLAAAAKRRLHREAKIEWERAWALEKISRPTRRLIEVPTKKTLQYWFGLRKATTSILIQLRTGRIGLSAYLARINRRESARCDCELGNQTVTHVLLECPLHRAERDWMRRALSGQGIVIRRDEFLTRPEARTTVADFMVKTGVLNQFQAVDPTALGVEEVERE